MYKTAIFGAGQAGLMAAAWIPAGTELLCYIDNNKEKQGSYINGKPVKSPEEAIELEPDEMIVAVVNKEALPGIEEQVRNAGFRGKLTFVNDLRRIQDFRLAALRLTAQEIRKRGIEGDMAELGVYRGELSREMNELLPDRRLWLFDTFSGFDEGDIKIEEEITGKKLRKRDFSDTSPEAVRSILPHPEKAVFVPGVFPGSILYP